MATITQRDVDLKINELYSKILNVTNIPSDKNIINILNSKDNLYMITVLLTTDKKAQSSVPLDINKFKEFNKPNDFESEEKYNKRIKNEFDEYKKVYDKVYKARAEAKAQLGWDRLDIKIDQKCPQIINLLFTVLFLNYDNSKSAIQKYVKKFGLEEAERLKNLIDINMDIFTADPTLNTGTFSQGETLSGINQVRLNIVKTGKGLDDGDLREYIMLWAKLLQEHIASVKRAKSKVIDTPTTQESKPNTKVENKSHDKKTKTENNMENDLIKIFQQWKEQQQTQSDKRVNVFGIAKKFISKTAGSQEFAQSSLQNLVKKYGRCGQGAQTILISFWNECIGAYDTKSGKFTIDAEKFEKSKNDVAKLETNKKNTNKDEPLTEPVAEPETKPDADEPKEIKTETDADLIAREKKRVDNLGKAIANLTNGEKQAINQACSVISDDVQKRKLAYARLQRMTMLRAYWEDVMKSLKQRIEEIDKTEKTIQEAQKRLNELINSIRENQK